MKRLMVGLSGILLFAGSIWWALPRHRIDDQTFELIQNGMTAAQVEAIFRSPPGDYSTGSVSYFPPLGPPDRPWRYIKSAKIWRSDDASILIHFDDAGRVEAAFSEYRFPQASALAEWRDWLLSLVCGECFEIVGGK